MRITTSQNAQGRLQRVRTYLLGINLPKAKLTQVDKPDVLILPRLGDHTGNDAASHKVTEYLKDVCLGEK